jgi:HAD superfamily hydrolase (TIGR01662 family)
MKTIQAVIFDAGNTLVFVNPKRVIEILRGLGVEADAARFEEAQRQTRLQITRDLMAGGTGAEAHVGREYYRSLCRLSGVPPHLESEADRCLKEVNRLEHLWTHVADETPDALREIAEMGYRLAVVSNSDGRVDWLLRQSGLRDHFEFVIDSHVFGAEKPDPRIFRAATDRLGLDPGVCLYVGDFYPIDVVGARAAGLQAVLLDPWDQLDVDVDRIPTVAHLPEYLRSRRVVTSAT